MRFQPLADFSAGEPGYRILPLRFMRWSADEVFVTNDAGEFLFIGRDAFAAFADHRLPHTAPEYSRAQGRHLLVDSDSSVAIELLATKVRTNATSCGSTRLHLFVVTLRCDHSCPYCQVSRVTQDRTRFDMSRETAARARPDVWLSRTGSEDGVPGRRTTSQFRTHSVVGPAPKNETRSSNGTRNSSSPATYRL